MSENTSIPGRMVTHTINMRGTVIAVCIFAAVIGAAYSLQCIFHHIQDPAGYQANHQGTVTNCSSDQDVCMMTFFVKNKRDMQKNIGVQFQRRCAKYSQCNRTESMTTAGYYVAYSTTCCKTDSCLPPLPVLPQRKLNTNGVTCPACHTEKTTPCVPERAMACTGDELHCVFCDETMFNAFKIYSSGCGTRNVFKDNGEIVNSTSFYSKVSVTETSRTHSLRVGNFLWCHVCHEEYGSTCTKWQIMCPADQDVCLSEQRRITNEQTRRLKMQILRRCAKSSECKFDGSVTSREKIISIKTSCCDTDMCSIPESTWPLKRKKNNGKTCPICSPSNDTNCQESDVIQCTGDETHCIRYSMSIDKDTYSESEVLHGCCSVGICGNVPIKEIKVAQASLVIRNDIICSSGIRIIYQLFILMISKFVAVSLLKL